MNSSNFFLREKFVTELYLKKENKKAFAQAESKVRVHCTVFSVPTMHEKLQSFFIYEMTKVDTIFGASDFFGLGEKIN